MFHDRRQRHAERLRQRADRQSGLLGEPGQQGPPRRVGKRREGAVERRGIKLNHVVNYRRTVGAVKPHASDRWLKVKSNSAPPQASRLVRPWEAAHTRRMHPDICGKIHRRAATPRLP